MERNPYAKKLTEELSVRISKDTLRYFREQSEKSGIPLQVLINGCLSEVAQSGRQFEGAKQQI